MPDSNNTLVARAAVDLGELLAQIPKQSIGSALSDVTTSPSETSAAHSKDLFEEKKRHAWDKSTEARCDFTYKPRITRRGDTWFFSLWQKSVFGRTLTDIKSDPSMVPFFADKVTWLIQDVLGEELNTAHWCICTTPKRRHLVKNFATLISEDIAHRLSIPFYEDVAFCHSKERVNAVFSLNILPKEPNIIVFDDFVTTGSTLKAMRTLLREHHKTTIFFTGINNKL